MKSCIWYISKYVAPPTKTNAGGRGFIIMRELAKLGNQCVIITSDSNQLAEVPELHLPYLVQKIDGLEIHWVRTFKYLVAKSMRRILSWLNFEWRLWLMPKGSLPRPDVVVVSSLSLLTLFNGFILRKKYNCKLIFEIRDVWPLTITEEGGFSKYNPIVIGLAWVERLGYKYSDAIVGTMPNLTEHVTNVLGYQKKVHCIPMGIDPTSLADVLEAPADYVETYVPEGKFIVAYAGTIGITNALDTFFVCAKTLSENKNIHFLIIGDGDLKSKYQAEYGQLSNLTFAPKVPKQMVQSILAKCDLLYFSAHVSEVWRYGQSLNKIIDYMLAGKPIIASYSGFPSMINEAACGTYVQAGNISALRDEVLRFAAMSKVEREAMGMRARKWLIEHRSYASLAKNYFAVMFPQEPSSSGRVL